MTNFIENLPSHAYKHTEMLPNTFTENNTTSKLVLFPHPYCFILRAELSVKA